MIMTNEKKKKTRIWDFNFKGMRIEARLKKAFNTVIVILGCVGVFAIIAMLTVVFNFESAMDNYALPQGDIALFMNEYAECRSNMRGIIGYEEEEQVNLLLSKHEKRVEKTYERLENDIKPTIVTEEGEAACQKIEEALEAYFEKESEIIKLGSTTDSEKRTKAQRMATNELVPLYEALDEATLELMDINIKKEREMEVICEILRNGSIILIVFAIVVVSIISKRIAGNISRSISKPLVEIEARFAAFSKGDIQTPFPTSTMNDEIAELMNSAHDMSEALKLIISDVERLCEEMGNGNFDITYDSNVSYSGDLEGLLTSIQRMNKGVNDALREVDSLASQVNVGASNLADAALDLAEGATNQAASVDEMLETMDTVSTGLKDTVENVEAAFQQALKCADDATVSRQEMDRMIESMNRISETSKKIENIIAEIEDIASQTNLLSLNASIEAARAGEAGRGFSVVADQIRVLADQSAKSAISTRELVSNTLSEINEGSRVADRTAEVLEGVVNAIQGIAESSKELSVKSGKQLEAVQQADAGIVRISEVVQSNSAAAEECSATSEELSAMVTSMHELVSRFELSEEEH